MKFCILVKFTKLLLVIFIMLAWIFTSGPRFLIVPGIQEAQAITVGTPSTNSCDCNQLTVSSHNISGSDVLVLVGVSLGDGANDKTISSVTYNGINLTQLVVNFSASRNGSGNDDSKYAGMWYPVPSLNPDVGNANKMAFEIISVSDDSSSSSSSSSSDSDSGGDNNYAELWYLDPSLNPTDGSYDVVVTIDNGSANKITVGVITVTGVDQTTPIDTGTVQSGSGEASQNTLAVTSESGDLIMDIIGTKANSITPDGSQAELWDLETGGSGVSGNFGGASTKSGAASVNMKYTLDEDKEFAHIVFNINAADDTTTTAFTPPPPPPPTFQGTIMQKPRNTR